MIKFLHAADLHLDAPFSSLGREQAVLRRREQREAVRRLVEICNAEGCHLLLLAGDLLDGAAAYPETVECLRESFEACRAEVFLAPGNHDPFTPGCAYDTVAWPDHVHIFTRNRIDAVPLPELGCVVYGAAFCAMESSALLRGFYAEPSDAVKLMVLHGELKADSVYNPITEAEIAVSGLDYLALGHIHRCSGLLRAGKTAYGWPGCLMGRGFDETGEKGYILGEIDQNGCRTWFVPFPGRAYEILRVQAGDDAAAAIEAALPANTERDIYRILLQGESEPVDVRALERRFAGRFFGLTVRDETVPKRELWEAVGEDTLRGLFLRELKLRYDGAEDESERHRIAIAARVGLAAMEGRELP